MMAKLWMAAARGTLFAAMFGSQNERMISGGMAKTKRAKIMKNVLVLRSGVATLFNFSHGATI